MAVIGIPQRGLPTRAWPDGSIPTDIVAPITIASQWGVEFILFDAAHGERWPVHPIDANFGHDKTMVGSATLSFPHDDQAVSFFIGSTLGQEFPEVSLRVLFRGSIIWSGPVVSARLATRGAGGVVELTCEHFWGYFLRKRSMYATFTGALIDAFDVTEEADNLVLGAMRDNVSTPVTPSGHPGGRDDFGSFTPTIASDHSPALAPSTRSIEQAGNNLLDLVTQWCEMHDLAPVLTDAATSTLILDVDYPFEDTDLDDLVIFGQWHGNMASFELTSDRSGLANLWAVEGKTAKTPQYERDTASITLWGVVESFAQRPEDTHVSSVIDSFAAELAAAHGSAKIAYRAEVIETDGHQWVTDFFWRDKIRIDEAIFGIQATQTVNAWSMSVSGGRMHRLDLILGVARPDDIMREVVGYTGLAGPRIQGSPWRNRRQS